MKKMVFFTILLLSLAAADEGWHIEVIDTGYLTGIRNTIDITSTGEPRMLYSKYYGGGNFYEIIYAYWDGYEWKKDVVDIGTCCNCSLSIDSLDRPHITYIDGSNKLVYAYHDGSEWQIHQFGWGAPFGYLEIEIDSNNQPHIGYQAAYLMYLYWDGEEWQRETVDSSDVAGGCSMELDSYDYPHFSYMVRGDDYDNYVTYTWWDGFDWNSETIGEVYLLYSVSDIDIDKEDKPHICYIDSIGDYIFYTHLIDGEWQTDFLDSGSYTNHLSVETDAQNNPHVAYSDGNYIKYAYWDGIEWQYTQVDQHGHEGDWCSLVLDSEDNPHISYSDRENSLFKYAWYGEDLGVGVNDLAARADDEGILVNWFYDGPTSASLKLLRASGEESWIGATSYSLPVKANKYLDRGVMPGVEYRYWLEVTEEDGSVHRFGPTEPVTIPPGSGSVTLSEPYPCPATGRVTLEYAIPEATHVELVVYDLAGRRVETLVDGEECAGRHAVDWDTSSVSPGVYLYSLATESAALTRRLVVTR